jgi:arylsulfatase A-like enzyme
VILLVSNPGLQSATVTTPVETAQMAPTILEALGFDPGQLQAVQAENTPLLPGLFF